MPSGDNEEGGDSEKEGSVGSTRCAPFFLFSLLFLLTFYYFSFIRYNVDHPSHPNTSGTVVWTITTTTAAAASLSSSLMRKCKPRDYLDRLLCTALTTTLPRHHQTLLLPHTQARHGVIQTPNHQHPPLHPHGSLSVIWTSRHLYHLLSMLGDHPDNLRMATALPHIHM